MKRSIFPIVVTFIALLCVTFSSGVCAFATAPTITNGSTVPAEETVAFDYSGENSECSVTYDASLKKYTITLKATGYKFIWSGSRETKLTITNNNSYDLKISYSNGALSNGGSLTSPDNTATVTDGTLGAGSSLTFVLKSPSGANTTAVVVSLTVEYEGSAVTATLLGQEGSGALSIAASNLSSGNIVTDTKGAFSYTVTENVTDYVFYGFRRQDGTYLDPNVTWSNDLLSSKNGNQTATIAGVTSDALAPVFVKADTALYKVDNNYYPFLDEAIKAAGTSSTITVHKSGVAYHSTKNFDNDNDNTKYTLSSTLLVPYGSNDSGNTSTTTDEYIPIKNAYRTLTILSGDTLVVNGTLIVNGIQGTYRYLPSSGAGRTGCMYMGTIQGDYGCIDLRGIISIENGGTLHARGLIVEKDDTTAEEINSGTGEIVAKQGSNVYQLAELVDWRGGTSSKAVYETVFPLNVFHVQNIQVKTEYQYGSALSAYYYVLASGFSKTGTIAMISSTTDSLFTLSRGSVVFRYDRVSSRADGTEIFAKTTVEVCGDISINKISLKVSAGLLGTYEMTTSGKEIPLSGAFDIEIASGSKMTLTENIKVLPGSRVTIKEGGEVVLDGGKLYLYDVGDFNTSYSYNTYRRMPISARLGTYSHSRLSGRGQTDPDHGSVLCHSNVLVTEKTDGELIVEGTLTIKNGGGVYSSTDATSESTVQFSSDSSQIQTGGAITGKIVVVSATNGLVTIQEVSGANETTTAENFSFAIGKIMGSSGTSVTTFATSDTIYCTNGDYWYIPSLPVHSSADRTDDGMQVDAKYRLQDYLWLNAICYLDADYTGVTQADVESGKLSITLEGADLVVVDGDDGLPVIYIVKKVPADEIADAISFIIEYDGKKSAPVTVSIRDCKDGTTETDELVDALLAYGEAAKKYFVTGGTPDIKLDPESIRESLKGSTAFGKTADKEGSYNKNGTSVTLTTKGANVLFEERLSLMFGFQFSSTGMTADDILQVGVLIGSSDVNTAMTVGASNVTKAYILYNSTAFIGESGNKPILPDGAEYEVSDKSSVSWEKLNAGGRMVLYMDLLSIEYTSAFEFRPYAVTKDGTVIYGQQYAYGLADYINNMLYLGDDALQTSIGSNKNIDAFRNLLITTWNYALKAEAKFTETN